MDSWNGSRSKVDFLSSSEGIGVGIDDVGNAPGIAAAHADGDRQLIPAAGFEDEAVAVAAAGDAEVEAAEFFF